MSTVGGPTTLHVLIVDDDPNTQRVLTRLLASEGHDAEACGSGAQALSQLRAHRHFDVLLTDLVMPEMSGVQLVNAARALDPELRCLIMSGHARAADVPKDVEWVSKPIDIDRLLTELGT